MYHLNDDQRTELFLPALRGDWMTFDRLLSEMELDDVEVVTEVLQRAANRANRVYFKKLAQAYDTFKED